MDRTLPFNTGSDNENREARMHFLHSISQMNSNSVLMRRHDDGRLEAVYASPSFAEMMDCISEEEARRMMDGPRFFKTTHPEDRPFVRSMLKRRITDDGSSDLTIQKITARRRKIWCRVHYAFVDEFNEHYIFCTYTDVTALKQYEERLRSVYITLGNNFYQINADTLGLLRVNLTRNAVEEVKGRDLYDTDSVRYPYSEVLLRRAQFYPIRSEQEQFLKTFQRDRLIAGYLEGKTAVSEILYSRRKNGAMCYVRFSATLTRHPLSGDMIAFITEELCNAAKVQETLTDKILVRQFDMVAYLVNGNYGVTIGDASLIQKGSIFPTTRTGSYRYYLNHQVAPAIKGGAAARKAALKALALETVEEQIKIREPYAVNIAIESDGETYYKHFDFYSVNPEARFYIVLKSDTTEAQREQMLRNEQLRAALEEAKQANVAKTAFLSSMSHEIRTPMNAIIGLDKIALTDPDLSAHTREQLEKIGVSAKHLLGLINDILDMSRIESGRMVLKNEEFSFRAFLEQINTLASSQCQDRALRYDCVIRSAMDDYYIGDDMKLKQVLINILGNAVKFTPAPGTVSLFVERVARFDDQSTLRFIIKDTGIGMDAEYLPKIFEAFSQEDATTTNRYGGSGLGMAITKNIVEMMNGNISVQSEKGVGSEFTVNVTLRNSDRKEDGGAFPENMDALIIGFDPLLLEQAKTVLEGAGIPADLSSDSGEALEMVRLRLARRRAYPLILADARIPEEDEADRLAADSPDGQTADNSAADGQAADKLEADILAVIRCIREQNGGKESIIILLSSREGAEIEARSAGADGVLTKSLTAVHLLDTFRQVMDSRGTVQKREVHKADLKNRRILLAEDMEINAEIMMELLDMREMRSEHAENGQLAVDLFASKPSGYFDAVLMDVRMPVLDGLGAAAAIRALDRPDAKTIPIIAMTANAFDEDVQRSLQAGMNAHLSKPVEPDRLYATLEELIQD